MRKFYAFIVLCFLGLSVNAQTFTYSNGDSVHTELQYDTYADAITSFSTNPVGAITFKWELISHDFPFEWYFSLCDFSACYPGIPPSGTMTPISGTDAANGVQGYFKLTVGGGWSPGSATAKFYLYDSNDYNVGDTVTFTFNMADQTSVGEEELAQIEIYPNPANKMVTIDNIQDNMGEIKVMNIMGQTVYSINAENSTKEVIDISSFDAGIYFVSYRSNEGILRTEKLTIR